MRERHAFVDVLEDHHYFRIHDYYAVILFVMTLFYIKLRYLLTFMLDIDNHGTWVLEEYDSDDESDEEYESDSISIDSMTFWWHFIDVPLVKSDQLFHIFKRNCEFELYIYNYL